MDAPSFKDCLAADIHNVFLNRMEFADTHNVNGREMDVMVDENELLERDKAKVMKARPIRTCGSRPRCWRTVRRWCWISSRPMTC